MNMQSSLLIGYSLMVTLLADHSLCCIVVYVMLMSSHYLLVTPLNRWQTIVRHCEPISS